MLLTEQLYGSITTKAQDHELTTVNTQDSLVAILNLVFSCNAALIIFILEVSQDVVVLTFRHYGKNASFAAL